ncbi:MAG TPA: hypothetical protein VE996_09280 [Terriglobales bacterium]|nr:hypothetical protein [Terriglobales bacterium]
MPVTNTSRVWQDVLFPPAITALAAAMFYLSYVRARGMRRPFTRALMIHGTVFWLGMAYAIVWQDWLAWIFHWRFAWVPVAALWGWLVLRDALRRYRRPQPAEGAVAPPTAPARARAAGAERWLAAAWMIVLAGAMIAWAAFFDHKTMLLWPLVWSGLAAASLAWPGARRARAAAGLRGLLPWAIIGAVAVHTWPAFVLVAGLALALWLLARGRPAPRYQDLSEITRG